MSTLVAVTKTLSGVIAKVLSRRELQLKSSTHQGRSQTLAPPRTIGVSMRQVHWWLDGAQVEFALQVHERVAAFLAFEGAGGAVNLDPLRVQLFLGEAAEITAANHVGVDAFKCLLGDERLASSLMFMAAPQPLARVAGIGCSWSFSQVTSPTSSSPRMKMCMRPVSAAWRRRSRLALRSSMLACQVPRKR